MPFVARNASHGSNLLLLISSPAALGQSDWKRAGSV
jgi:hypothetical protein